MAHAKSVRSTAGPAAVAVGLIVFMIGAWTTAGGAKPGSAKTPAGNGGTVKVDGGSFPPRGNDPHVGCAFSVVFRGYTPAAGNSATVSFTGQSPTGGGSLGGGSVDISSGSGSKSFNLTSALLGVAPHPHQGWHVRLSVNAPGSQGSDLKHKTYWVRRCPLPSTTTTTTGGGGTTTTTTVDLDGDTTTTTEAEVEALVETTTTTGAEVKGVVVERPRAAPPEELAFTGSNHTVALALVGLALMVLGSVLMLGGQARPAVRRAKR